MNDFYAVNISSGEVVKRYYIFGIVILYFKKVCYLTVGLLRKIPAYQQVGVALPVFRAVVMEPKRIYVCTRKSGVLYFAL